jgi:hypothetical protein
MNIPMTAFGKGFINSRGRSLASSHLYQVNVSNGMPIVSYKHVMNEKHRSVAKNKSFNNNLKRVNCKQK